MLYLRIKDLEMKIINLQDLCDNLNRIIGELKNFEQPTQNNLNNKLIYKQNLNEYINNITKNNLATGFVCNNNE